MLFCGRLQGPPFQRYRPYGTGYELYFDAHLLDLRKEDFQLAETYERLATYNRKVQWTLPTDQPKDRAHEFIAPIIYQLAQRCVAAEMFRFVSITARAPKGTLLSNLQR